jgi:hypothetical protein
MKSTSGAVDFRSILKQRSQKSIGCEASLVLFQIEILWSSVTPRILPLRLDRNRSINRRGNTEAFAEVAGKSKS